MADLHSNILDRPHRSRSNFVNFHAVFGNTNCPHNRLAPHLGLPRSAPSRCCNLVFMVLTPFPTHTQGHFPLWNLRLLLYWLTPRSNELKFNKQT